MSWNFEVAPPMGGATGEAFSNVLFGTGMAPASVLAREAIQNSVDAGPRAGKVKVAFRRFELLGADKNRFVEKLCLRTEFQLRQKVLDLPNGNCLRTIDDPKIPLELLFIDDYGSHGLYGNPFDPQSHFHRLLFSLGNSTKSRDSGASGGSYGYGKSVYSSNSRLRTIVAYTTFEPRQCDDGHYARLIGCSYFQSHSIDNFQYTGRAWFGVRDSTKNEIVHPFEDEAAHQLASELGFSPRDQNSTGTSILIVDCPVRVDDLRQSIETWWWPRIIEDDLDIDIQLDGKRVTPPRPRLRSDLRPFLHCYDMVIKRGEPEGKHDKADDFNRLHGVPLGTYGFTIINERPELEDDEDQRLLDQIALIRSPRMVVAYLEVGVLPLTTAGVFLASEEVDHSLKMSEPPAHDKWDPSSDRLQSPVEKEQVTTILKRLKNQFRKFANEAIPPPPKNDVHVSLLERMLGTVFRSPKSAGEPPNQGQIDPIEITFSENPYVTASNTGLTTHGAFRVGLKKTSEVSEALVTVSVKCFPIEDDGVARDDPIPISLSSEDVEDDLIEESNGVVSVLIGKQFKPKFKFVSEQYPADWTASVSVSVQQEA